MALASLEGVAFSACWFALSTIDWCCFPGPSVSTATPTTTAAAIAAHRRFGHTNQDRNPMPLVPAAGTPPRSSVGRTMVSIGGMLNATASRQSAQRERCRTTPSRSAPDKACSANAVSTSASGWAPPGALARRRSWTILGTSDMCSVSACSGRGDLSSRERFWTGILR